MSERRGLLAALGRTVDALPGGVAFALALTAVAIVGMGDELTGSDLHFTPLYFLPIWFAAWFLGAGSGLLIALASAVAWWAADVATRFYAPRPGVQVLNFAMELAVFATVAVLVATVRRRLRAESGLARTDALTGLLNRRGFLEVARREIARSRRTGRPLTVAMIDVDRFKEVNDGRGHDAGDRLLAALGAALRSSMRAVDACARLGGDEFAVLLPDTDDLTVDAVLGRTRQVLAQAAAEATGDDGASSRRPDARSVAAPAISSDPAAGGANPVTVSIGAATFAAAPSSLDEMLRAADRLLREVKAAGRDGLRHDSTDLSGGSESPSRS